MRANGNPVTTYIIMMMMMILFHICKRVQYIVYHYTTHYQAHRSVKDAVNILHLKVAIIFLVMPG